MTSAAFDRWLGERTARLDELQAAHRTVGGDRRGRRWRTAGLNAALVLRLAAEFQGYARELHDTASRQFAIWASPGNPVLEEILLQRLTDGRQLARGNAQPSSLGADFGRFGVDLWPALSARDALSGRFNASLERLNQARNALAHDDEARLESLRLEGFPLTLRTFVRWRRDIDGLAGILDAEVASHLGRLFGQPRPW